MIDNYEPNWRVNTTLEGFKRFGLSQTSKPQSLVLYSSLFHLLLAYILVLNLRQQGTSTFNYSLLWFFRLLVLRRHTTLSCSSYPLRRASKSHDPIFLYETQVNLRPQQVSLLANARMGFACEPSRAQTTRPHADWTEKVLEWKWVAWPIVVLAGSQSCWCVRLN